MAELDYSFLQADQPIENAAEDMLDRGGFARLVADQVIAGPPAQGFVIALIGPWGSGKTSLLNLVVEEVKSRGDTVVLRFDPWLFSHAEELVVRFLGELSSQLRERREERLIGIADSLSTYGDALSQLGGLPVVGVWATLVGKLAKAPAALRTPYSVHHQRTEIQTALAKLDRRVLVLIDDLDRLEGDQIRDVLRLVKLVGDFPNVTYLLAFDDSYVSSALGLKGDEGQEYLDKIIQGVHHIPEIDMSALTRMLLAELDRALSGADVGYWSSEDWQNLFVLAIRPLFRSVRDVRRYLNAAPVTLRLLNGEVAGADALALEALRVFVPNAYALLPAMVDTLTESPDTRRESHREDDSRIRVEALVAAAPEADRDAVRQMIRRLFPSVGGLVGGSTVIHGASEMKRKLRVANPDVLRIFLRKTLPENVAPATMVANVVSKLEDEGALSGLFEELEPRMLENVVARLEAHVVDQPPEAKTPAIVALYNVRRRLPEPSVGFFAVSPNIALQRVVLRMLEAITDEAERAGIIATAIPRIERLLDRIDLIDLVGHAENVGHRLVSESDAATWLDAELDVLLSMDPIELVQEPDFPRIVHLLRSSRPEAAADWEARLIDSNDRLLVLLTASLGEATSQTVGDVAVTKNYRLPWETLGHSIGEERLCQRVLELAASLEDRAEVDEKSVIALDLAVRYATGDRPNDRWS
jgi:hypothetical protein